MSVRIIAAASFKRNIRELKKRYPHVDDDLRPLFRELQGGETPGDKIPGAGYAAFKVRVKSSDIHKGKSGGYRVIYYLKTAECIYLVAMYVKSQRENFDKKLLKQVIIDILGEANLPC